MASSGSDWWHKVSPYLDQALAMPENARAGWLQALHEKEPEIAREVQAMLEEHGALVREHFLEHSVPGPVRTGEALGAYTVVSPIGQGGMGNVWLAERNDGQFERLAAVKFLSFALAGRE